MEVKRGEIWFCNMGTPDGSEQRGKRPVLILQNDVGNHYSPTVIVAALTHVNKKPMPTHVRVKAEQCGIARDSTIMMEQIRTIDKRKLYTKNGAVSDEVMRMVDEALKISLGLVPVPSYK